MNKRFVDVELTKTELYYAIKAFERLDNHGEMYMGSESKIDGHFQRDDFACDFINPEANPDDYAHFNQKRYVPNGFVPVSKVYTSDDCPGGKPLLDKSKTKDTPNMSQDQVIWLLMGFMLIEKCLECTHTVKLKNGKMVSFNFSEQARRHSTNMINYCKYKYPNQPNKANWPIYRPDGQKVDPGQNAYLFKYPLSIIGARM